jgi:hypothetical protein
MEEENAPKDQEASRILAGESLESRTLSDARSDSGRLEKSLNPASLSDARDPNTTAPAATPPQAVPHVEPQSEGQDDK